MQSVHVRRGDTVGVIAGSERGKRGKVLRVLPEKGRVLVEHVNMIKKHQRPTQKLRQGGIIEREGPLADRKSTRLNSSHLVISYAVFCLKKKKKPTTATPRQSRTPNGMTRWSTVTRQPLPGW